MSRQRSGRTGVTETVTVKFYDFELTVKGYYIEGEKQERDYPGCPSEFEIESAELTKGSALDLINEALNHDELVVKCIEQIESEL
jgi:hypothetical protein